MKITIKNLKFNKWWGLLISCIISIPNFLLSFANLTALLLLNSWLIKSIDIDNTNSFSFESELEDSNLLYYILSIISFAISSMPFVYGIYWDWKKRKNDLDDIGFKFNKWWGLLLGIFISSIPLILPYEANLDIILNEKNKFKLLIAFYLSLDFLLLIPFLFGWYWEKRNNLEIKKQDK